MATRTQREEGEQPRAPRAPRKPTREAILERGPWLPTPYDVADASALQAMQRGEAGPEQQRRIVRWLIAATGLQELSYRPGAEDGRRDTDFAEGKRWVGLQIAKLLTADIATLRRSEPLADEHEPKS